MGDMGKGKSQAVHKGGFFLTDGFGKTPLNDTPEKQFLTNGTENHSRACHNRKQYQFVIGRYDLRYVV